MDFPYRNMICCCIPISLVTAITVVTGMCTMDATIHGHIPDTNCVRVPQCQLSQSNAFVKLVPVAG